METPWMCKCGHVRGAHGGDSESCRMCACEGFVSRHYQERLADLERRIDKLEGSLDTIARSLDGLVHVVSSN